MDGGEGKGHLFAYQRRFFSALPHLSLEVSPTRGEKGEEVYCAFSPNFVPLCNLNF